MNKKYIPIAIALLITAITIWGQLVVSKTIITTCNTLDNIYSCAENSDYTGASDNIKMLLCNFEAKQHLLELFIKRENVAAVLVNLHGLNAYVNKETIRDLMSEAAKAKEQVYMLNHIYSSIL